MTESHRDEIAKLETLHANNPDGRVFTHLAEAYRKAGELDRARDVLDQGIAKHPDYSSAHVVFGRVLSDLGETELAMNAFQRVLELDRHNLVALRSLAELLKASGRAGDALVHYRELTTLDPADPELRTIVSDLEAGLQSDEDTAPVPADAPVDSQAPPAQRVADGVPTAGVPTARAPDEQEASIADAAAARQGAVVENDDAAPEPVEAPSATREVGPKPDEPKAVPDEVKAAPIEAKADAEVAKADAEVAKAAPVEPPPDLEVLGAPQASLPGDLAALAGPEGAGRNAEDVEFYDFRATSLTEFGWATAKTEASKPSRAERAHDAAVREAEPHDGDQPAGEPVPSAEGEETVPAAEVDALFGANGDSGGPNEPDSADAPAPDAGGAPDGDPKGGEWLSTAEWARLRSTDELSASPGEEDSPQHGGSGEDESDDDEVVTTTMAELYTAQGFHDRAIEVYRALLRAKPDDSELLERLRSAESAARSARAKGPARGRGAQAANVPDEPADGTWAEDVESVWTGGGGVAAGDPTPYAWTEAESPGESRGAIGEYFRDLLAWRPGADDSGSDEPVDAILLDEASVVSDSDPGAQDRTQDDETRTWFERAGAEGEAEEEADEDLDMFRAWLQSLKK